MNELLIDQLISLSATLSQTVVYLLGRSYYELNCMGETENTCNKKSFLAALDMRKLKIERNLSRA